MKAMLLLFTLATSTALPGLDAARETRGAAHKARERP
jgi:hypothetical protein